MKISGYEVEASRNAAQVGPFQFTRDELYSLLEAMNLAPREEEKTLNCLILKEGYSYLHSYESSKGYVNFHVKKRDNQTGSLRVGAVADGWDVQPTVDFCLSTNEAKVFVAFLQELIKKNS